MNGIGRTGRMAALACAGTFALAFTGCQSVSQDKYRAGFHAEIVPAKFKPLVEPIRGAPTATGTADSLTAFWILPLEWPSKFSSDPNSPESCFGDALKDAAVYEACASSGADILLAPRFTEERVTGPLWFFRKRTVSVEGIPARIVGAQEIPLEKWPILFGANSGTQLIRTVQ